MAMDDIIKEAARINFPLKNTKQMMGQYAQMIDNTPTALDLETIFGPKWREGYYTLVADGAKMYLALGYTAGAISDGLNLNLPTGTATLVEEIYSWPLPDGQERNYEVPWGREVGSGLDQNVDYKKLHLKVASGGSTGTFRIFRSSHGQDGSLRFARSNLGF